MVSETMLVRALHLTAVLPHLFRWGLPSLFGWVAPRLWFAPQLKSGVGAAVWLLRPRHHSTGLNWSAPGGSSGSVPWNIVVLLSLLSLLPALLVAVTPFTRLLVVFHFLRQALGTQTAPSNQTLIGLSLVLTYFLMQPVGNAIYLAAVVPFQRGQVDALAAVELGAPPLRHFMLKYAREKDLALFLELAKAPRPARAEDVPMRVVVPAYILSELKTGFQIGVALFLPFLVIDLVVAAVTTSIGMMQLPPVIISTPLKILLFVMVDGWNLLVGSLMKSFA
jgi:flagellar biosynthetic protein FliP